jgi:hypothetical protein
MWFAVDRSETEVRVWYMLPLSDLGDSLDLLIRPRGIVI